MRTVRDEQVEIIIKQEFNHCWIRNLYENSLSTLDFYFSNSLFSGMTPIFFFFFFKLIFFHFFTVTSSILFVPICLFLFFPLFLYLLFGGKLN